MIKNIVFDIGGVIVRFVPEHVAFNFTQNKEEADLIVSKLMRHPDWLEFDRGTLSIPEIAENFYQREQYPVEKTIQFFDFVLDSLDLMEETVNFIKLLHSKGIGIYYLSNMSTYYMDNLIKRHDVFKYFKGGVYSEKVGFVKPEKDIYLKFEEQEKLDKDSFIFLDDLEKNINVAKELGWNSFIYNYKNLKDVQNHILTKYLK